MEQLDYMNLPSIYTQLTTKQNTIFTSSQNLNSKHQGKVEQGDLIPTPLDIFQPWLAAHPPLNSYQKTGGVTKRSRNEEEP